MSSVRDRYVEAFGEDEAARIEAAANSHRNGINDENLGSDPFKWALLICIGYQCIDVYREHHGIKTPETEIKDWIKAFAGLESHDGDCDYLALFGGAYAEYVRPTLQGN